MTTMTFLAASTDAPRPRTDHRVTMPLPEPNRWEYRLFYNHRDEEQQRAVTVADSDARSDADGDAAPQPQMEAVLVPIADYVSAQCDHTPTDDDWRECLAANGFTTEQIEDILAQCPE